MKKLLLISLFLAGCSVSGGFDKYSSLIDKGILPLSSDNAYLGSNLFIAEEAEKSVQLFQFLKGRGGPAAMELIEDGDETPTLYMYYPKDREVYAAELVLIKNPDESQYREWLVRGPFGIERKDFRELSRLETSFISEPPFVIKGREIRFRNEVQRDVTTSVLIPAVPTPVPTPKKIVKKPTTTSGEVITQKGTNTPTMEHLKPINSDQQAILQARGFAERGENGDLIHTVKDPNETIATLAEWYTGSNSHSEAIMKASGISAGSKLSVGTKIKIPASLVKNNRPYSK